MKFPNQKYFLIAALVMVVFFVSWNSNKEGFSNVKDWVTGTWFHSCDKKDANYQNFLIANCKKRSGKFKETRINWKDCKINMVGNKEKIDVYNDDGTLKCKK